MRWWCVMSNTVCMHGRDTGQPWGACSCTAVECHCPERIEMLRAKVLRDAVDYHTRLASVDDPYARGYVLVRSKFCNHEECSYYSEKPPK